MSFLPGRMAATENAFFREQSKAAAKLLRDKMDPQKLAAAPAPAPTPATTNGHADTLPEILMHSLPTPPPTTPPAKLPSPSLIPEGSTLAGVSQAIMKKLPKGEGPQIGIMQKRYGNNDPVELLSTSVPSQATFGPRRWSVEHTPGSQPVPSTANAAKFEAEPYVDPPTQQEVQEGMVAIAKAFGVATTIIFGGAAVGVAYVGHRLEWNSMEDVRIKTRESMLPVAASMRQWFKPTQQWAHQTGGKWKMEEAERQALGVEFAQSLGVQSGERLTSKNNANQSKMQQIDR